MKYIIPIFLASILAIYLMSCSNMNNDEVKAYTWRYTNGFHLGDILELDNHNLKGDTIYSKNEPVAIIIERSKEIPFVSSSIEIKDFNSEEVGTYHEIGTLR